MKQLFNYILVAAIAFSSCNNNASHEEGEEVHAHEAAEASHEEEGHNHAAVMQQLVGYNANFELYAEVAPLVVGESTTILAHFTHLKNYKPLTEGKVTISLIVGSKGLRQTIEKPTRPGIYQFSIKPESAGAAKFIFEIETSKGKERIAVENITVFADDHEAEHASTGEAKPNPAAVSFTKEQSWGIDFSTTVVAPHQFGAIIKSVGEIQSAPNDETIITAKSSGIVTLNNQVFEGNSISAGQSIVTISGKGLGEGNASLKLSEAKNRFEQAKADYERATELAKSKIVSEKELRQATTEFENAKAAYNDLNGSISEKGQTVSSPKSGYIKLLMVSNGQYVEQGQPLATISQTKNLVIKAEIQQRYLPLLKGLYSATITATDGKTYSMEELHGRVLSRGEGLTGNSYLLPVYLEVNNQGNLYAGSLVDIYLKAKTGTATITVPNASILEEQGLFFVYLQLTPESFEKREVKIGATDGIETVIVSGLTPNDRVVSQGAVLIKAASASGKIDPHAGHVH
jgi:RND family efflux transporter MFP subunit